MSELGFGAAALGNLYRPVSDHSAEETLQAALDAGITYFDTAPYYGFGLSERRLGNALRTKRDVVLSTKVGRLLAPDHTVLNASERFGFVSPMPFRPVFDYSHDGILRSFEDSLQRLGMARINILYVHDIGRLTHGPANHDHIQALTKGGGLKALERLRSEGVVDGFGIGVNEVPICLEIMEATHLDVILLAGRYTLLEQHPLKDLLPRCAQAGTKVVVGGPYNSGVLATGTRSGAAAYYDYAPASADILAKVAAIEGVCERHAVPLAAAALQFPIAHPVVSSVIPGLGSADRIRETIALTEHTIPDEFWSELKSEGLLDVQAPVGRAAL